MCRSVSAILPAARRHWRSGSCRCLTRCVLQRYRTAGSRKRSPFNVAGGLVWPVPGNAAAVRHRPAPTYTAHWVRTRSRKLTVVELLKRTPERYGSDRLGYDLAGTRPLKARRLAGLKMTACERRNRRSHLGGICSLAGRALLVSAAATVSCTRSAAHGLCFPLHWLPVR